MSTTDRSTTISEIYAAINPLPAMLTAKGCISPSVEFQIEANARFCIVFFLPKSAKNLWDRDISVFTGETFEEAITEARASIDAMPSPEQAKLNRFMASLANVIDAGRADGIDTDFLNPLVATMKRLSENALTHQPVEA
ncbi:hypothetical protein [Rhodopseudomonas sp. B29]|uniref:hypothetical protein n=1 Tax=Rhodopseudomonas sp. B29 TaxID=95607 RepID=UPI00034B76F0|nr:hypothetical protein [Rhodopseudomonas sp. B29]